MLADRECALLAQKLLKETCHKYTIAAGQLTIHAHGGGPMKSKPVEQLLLPLQVTRSHSRPRVSNDNPYSEAGFKTMKSSPLFPERFSSQEDAQTFCQDYFLWYNTRHHHTAWCCSRPNRCISATRPSCWRNGKSRWTRLMPPIRNALKSVRRQGSYPTPCGSMCLRCPLAKLPHRLPFEERRMFARYIKILSLFCLKTLDTFRVFLKTVMQGVCHVQPFLFAPVRSGYCLSVARGSSGAVTLVKARQTTDVTQTAVRDTSTPAAQNGYALAAVQRWRESRGSFLPAWTRQTPGGTQKFEYNMDGMALRDTTLLWISAPAPPGGTDLYQWSRDFSAMGRASNGDTFRLPCALAHTYSFNPAAMLCVCIPTCYPDTYRFIDVTLQGKSGEAAHWRIKGLPPTKQRIAPNAAIVESNSQAGITVRGRANRPPGTDDVKYYLDLISPGSPAHQWATNVRSVEFDWMPTPSSPDLLQGSGETYPRERITKLDARKGKRPVWRVGGFGTETHNPYHAANRFLRVQVELTEFETYDESVTFHDLAIPVPANNKDVTIQPLVPQAQTVTTPSGIVVTLKASDGTPPGNSLSGQGTVLAPLFGITPVTSADKAVDLPASPLARKYGKSVRIALKAVAPFQQPMSMIDAANTRVYMTLPTAMPAHLKKLSMVVQQRVKLRTVPVTLTLPIHEDARSPLDF